ncbi:hypothetical protein ACHHV8_19500 [Paenibacillus sp. TAB 01]|uniref:hypothetical protein n=1 Tax=Paenibacillus sp. TAB 01 TaxID=3368988 RepID=UPI0037504381
MGESNEKQLEKKPSVELTDLSQEMSEEQLKDVKGGDLKVSSRPTVLKKMIRP